MTPIIVLIVYMLMLSALGIISWRRSKVSEDDYYLAGRGQGAIVTVLTIMASFFSSGAMLGIPGLVYRDGVGFMLFALNLPLAGAAIYVLGSRIRAIGKRRNYVTPADMIADYYGGSDVIRLLTALISFIYVIPYIIIQIKAGGHLAVVLFPEANQAFLLGTTALSLVTMFYVMIGGMRSVAWSDVVQGTLLLVGMLVAGIATVSAMGGIGPFFSQVNSLPPEALSLPGPSNAWSPWKLLTLALFASVGGMIQPGQWMRFYAADSGKTLRRSAVVFAIVLPTCFLFGIMLVGLGGRVLYPPELGVIPPNAAVKSIDQIVVVMMTEHIPQLLGVIGPVVVSLLLVAILAAAMSTADSNLHALSAILTRDVYRRYIRRDSSEKERAIVGKGVILVATVLAVVLVHIGESHRDFKPLSLIAEMMLFAVAFTCQLIPVTIDMLFVRKGTRSGAIAGMVVGLVVISTIFFSTKIVDPPAAGLSHFSRLFDTGAAGTLVNALVFIVVSRFTPKMDPSHINSFVRDLDD